MLEEPVLALLPGMRKKFNIGALNVTTTVDVPSSRPPAVTETLRVRPDP